MRRQRSGEALVPRGARRVEPDDHDRLVLAVVLGGDGVEGGDSGGVPDVGGGEVDDDVVGVVGVLELGVEVVAGGEEQLAGDPVDGGGGAVAVGDELAVGLGQVRALASRRSSPAFSC